MKIKKLLSVITAAAISASCFVGMAVSASAATTDDLTPIPTSVETISAGDYTTWTEASGLSADGYILSGSTALEISSKTVTIDSTTYKSAFHVKAAAATDLKNRQMAIKPSTDCAITIYSQYDASKATAGYRKFTVLVNGTTSYTSTPQEPGAEDDAETFTPAYNFVTFSCNANDVVIIGGDGSTDAYVSKIDFAWKGTQATDAPTEATDAPSEATDAPTEAPTAAPTEAPTPIPTAIPAEVPAENTGNTWVSTGELDRGTYVLYNDEVSAVITPFDGVNPAAAGTIGSWGDTDYTTSTCLRNATKSGILTVTPAVDDVLTLTFRRQADSGSTEATANAGKDVIVTSDGGSTKLVPVSYDTAAYDETLAYYVVQATYEVEAGTTYSIYGSGTTIQLYQIDFGTPVAPTPEPSLPEDVTITSGTTYNSVDGDAAASVFNGIVTAKGLPFNKVKATVTLNDGQTKDGTVDFTEISGLGSIEILVVVNKAADDILSVVLSVE
ncbi:MAG: hypothetical protein ACI4RF_02955 [Eubacterium sp.]